MARQNRYDLIGEASVGVYHCINRCVRQAFFCGEDRQSGRNYDHRKSWIQRRLEFLAGIFAVDVLGFSVMPNQFQLRSDKRGSIPADLAPILERLQLSTSCWVDLIAGLGRWFRRTAGRPSSMEEASRRQGARWLQNIARARSEFEEFGSIVRHRSSRR